MPGIIFQPLPTETVRRYQNGAPDAYGNAPERVVSDGQGAPCRHCLHGIPKGAAMLVLAHRPFPAPQPYAETGPIFLCAEDCGPWRGPGVPPVLTTSDSYLLRGYGGDDRIVYGSGRVIPKTEIPARARALLDDPKIVYVHVRSAANNCYQCRIEPG